MFEDDEDEFGLPSIANLRRKGRRKQQPKTNDTEGGSGRESLGSTAWRGLDSGDIAEERGIPNYPTAKKTEGKILRPQYARNLERPCQFPSPNLTLLDPP